jgi:hypothetical protein
MNQQDIQNFAKQHGNRFHAEVVLHLRKNGWNVTVSPFYRDIATDKAREVDVIAGKVFYVPRGLGFQPFAFPVMLVIECKYVNKEILFWFDTKDSRQARDLITRSFPELRDNANIEKHHWYPLNEDVAKLFANINLNKDERQPENEVIFSSIDKVLNSLIYYRNKPSEDLPINPGAVRKGRIYYPLVLVDRFSKLYKTTFGQPEATQPLDEESWFPAEVNYAYTNLVGGRFRFPKFEYFLVDIVNFARFDQYLTLLEREDIEAVKSMYPS